MVAVVLCNVPIKNLIIKAIFVYASCLCAERTWTTKQPVATNCQGEVYFTYSTRFCVRKWNLRLCCSRNDDVFSFSARKRFVAPHSGGWEEEMQVEASRSEPQLLLHGCEVPWYVLWPFLFISRFLGCLQVLTNWICQVRPYNTIYLHHSPNRSSKY